VKEHTLTIELNDKKYAELTCSPQYQEELTLGYLYSTGVISDISDVLSLSSDISFKNVSLKTVRREPRMTSAADGLCFPVSVLLSGMERLLSESAVFLTTGAVHSCALLKGGEFLHFMEDIGRHNALDKSVGAALRASTCLSEAAVLTSGRIPSDMMTKIVYSRIPIVVSRSAPTDEAIRLASLYNVTLCGFARGDRLNIYTGKHRIKA